jgi:hypothetical protein
MHVLTVFGLSIIVARAVLDHPFFGENDIEYYLGGSIMVLSIILSIVCWCRANYYAWEDIEDYEDRHGSIENYYRERQKQRPKQEQKQERWQQQKLQQKD